MLLDDVAKKPTRHCSDLLYTCPPPGSVKDLENDLDAIVAGLGVAGPVTEEEADGFGDTCTGTGSCTDEMVQEPIVPEEDFAPKKHMRTHTDAQPIANGKVGAPRRWGYNAPLLDGGVRHF